MARKNIVIDSSIIIQHTRVRSKRKSLFARSVLIYQPNLSVISVYEIELGAFRAERTSDIEGLRVALNILPLTEEIARKAASIDANLIKNNQHIGIRDVLIAATCLIHDLPVLSINKRHFERIEGLKLIDPDSLPQTD